MIDHPPGGNLAPWSAYYNGKFQAEQDYTYVEEQCPFAKTWHMTKKILLKTWTIYERVGKTGYQTPRFFLASEEEALTKIRELA